VLVALSTSGNASNVCRAAEVARARSLPVLAMTGTSGGKLRELADLCICVPAAQTPHVQEFHLPIYHCLSLMLEEYFTSIGNKNRIGAICDEEFNFSKPSIL
jgi:D-sedoheptulose 7-phosphate isomerase